MYIGFFIISTMFSVKRMYFQDVLIMLPMSILVYVRFSEFLYKFADCSEDRVDY